MVELVGFGSPELPALGLKRKRDSRPGGASSLFFFAALSLFLLRMSIWHADGAPKSSLHYSQLCSAHVSGNSCMTTGTTSQPG